MSPEEKEGGRGEGPRWWSCGPCAPWPPSKAGHHLAGGDEGRPALGSGLEADSGWAVEHGRAALAAELVLVGPEDAGGGTGGLMEEAGGGSMSLGCHTGREKKSTGAT